MRAKAPKFPTSPTGTISLLPTFTFKPVIASKKINTILKYNNWSLDASQNRIVSSANKRWEICKPPLALGLAWNPLRKSPSSVLLNNLLNTSITNKNKRGDKGSPWRRPRELAKKPAGDPLISTEKWTVVIQAFIHLPHFSPNPILSIR